MTTSLIRRNRTVLAAPVEGYSLTINMSVNDSEDNCEDDEDDGEDEDEIDPDACKAHGDEPPSDAVVGLREWGGSRLLPLRPPQTLGAIAATTATTTALQRARGKLDFTTNGVELVYESQSWRVRDWNGVANLKQDGRSTREANLMPGTEIAIAGRTFIAESARSIALRNFCARLLGWSDARIAVVDQALRAIRLASSGRAMLVLSGSGDLVPVAHTIHRHTLGDEVPFVVSDPRRKNTRATVRGPANYASGTTAFCKAVCGTLCVRERRLPPDFEAVLTAFREPESGVHLVVCARGSTMSGAAQIDIPSLETRRSEVPRIVSEYVEDAIDLLHAPRDCVGSQDIEWIIDRSALLGGIAIPDIEKAALRVVAVKMTGDLTKAAMLLGMARISLERWLRRRHIDSV